MLQARCMLAISAQASAAMQNFPFSEPPVLFRERQIPLMGNSARILIVDDSRANAEALAASLAIDGLEARFALNGVDAIESLGLWQPHVFVLAISMPEHNGFAIARVLRSMPATRDPCGHHRVYGFGENRVLGDRSRS
jgi:two-component system OmpR family response regulator